MLKQIISAVTLAAAIIIVAIPLAFLQLLASEKQKKKNGSSEQTKKCNSVNCFIVINAIKKKDNNKKEAKAKTLAKVIATIAAATFEVGDIYKNNA